MYEVGISKDFRALHVMPGMEGPEGELHDHDYRVEVVVRAPGLDARGMVCDLEVLDKALGDLTARLDGSNLEVIRPPNAEAVTVEILARWTHDELATWIASTGVETLSVRVWESPVAFGGYDAPVAVSSS